MLRASLIFFVLGLVAMAIGLSGHPGISLEAARLLLFACLGLSILSFLGALLTDRGARARELANTLRGAPLPFA